VSGLRKLLAYRARRCGEIPRAKIWRSFAREIARFRTRNFAREDLVKSRDFAREISRDFAREISRDFARDPISMLRASSWTIPWLLGNSRGHRGNVLDLLADLRG
jgi:hypothetical protein